MATTEQPLTAGTAAFQFSGFRLYQIARFCIVFCTEMQSVAVGWQVYEITRRPLDLGLTGLVQFLDANAPDTQFTPLNGELVSKQAIGNK